MSMATFPHRAAEKDVADFGVVLSQQKYLVNTLLGKQATKLAIDTALQSMLSRHKSGDTLLLFFSGHGLQFEGSSDGYYCPVDARPFPDQKETLVSMKSVYHLLERAHRGAKIIMLDACRNDPSSARTVLVRSKGGLDSGLALTPPNGVAALFSCSPGQQSFEGEKNGLFTQAILECLRDGKSADENGEITWHHLLSYVKRRTERLAKAIDRSQLPDEKVNSLAGSPVIALFAPTKKELVANASNNHSATKKIVTSSAELAPHSLRVPFSPEKSITEQERWSKQLHVPVDAINTLGIELKMIPPGEFTSKADTKDINADPKQVSAVHAPRLIRVSAPYLISQKEITVSQFRQFVADSGYRTESESDGTGGWGIDHTGGHRRLIQSEQFSWNNTGFPQTDQHPVVNVSWNDAVAYCQWASRKTKTRIRLPTEAEWEFASRAGRQEDRPLDGPIDQLVKHANVLDLAWQENGWKSPKQTPCPANDGSVFTSITGRYQPNSFGLFDTLGNVFEWVQDDPTDNTKEPEERLCRGGSWFHSPDVARFSGRTLYAHNNRDFSLGFRVVCEVSSLGQ